MWISRWTSRRCWWVLPCVTIGWIGFPPFSFRLFTINGFHPLSLSVVSLVVRVWACVVCFNFAVGAVLFVCVSFLLFPMFPQPLENVIVLPAGLVVILTVTINQHSFFLVIPFWCDLFVNGCVDWWPPSLSLPTTVSTTLLCFSACRVGRNFLVNGCVDDFLFLLVPQLLGCALVRATSSAV